MKVYIKDFSVEMEVKSTGIEFEVRTPDDKDQVGDCYLSKAGLIWSVGKTSREKGQKIDWEDFIVIMKSPESIAAALKAAKKV
jgi:hypothetical protein